MPGGSPARFLFLMKHIIILGDGMADLPVERLGGKTLLQYAHKPMMDQLAKEVVVVA